MSIPNIHSLNVMLCCIGYSNIDRCRDITWMLGVTRILCRLKKQNKLYSDLWFSFGEEMSSTLRSQKNATLVLHRSVQGVVKNSYWTHIEQTFARKESHTVMEVPYKYVFWWWWYWRLVEGGYVHAAKACLSFQNKQTNKIISTHLLNSNCLCSRGIFSIIHFFPLLTRTGLVRLVPLLELIWFRWTSLAHSKQ